MTLDTTLTTERPMMALMILRILGGYLVASIAAPIVWVWARHHRCEACRARLPRIAGRLEWASTCARCGHPQPARQTKRSAA
jgi:rRNA maturation endonuclease Nob1